MCTNEGIPRLFQAICSGTKFLCACCVCTLYGHMCACCMDLCTCVCTRLCACMHRRTDMYFKYVWMHVCMYVCRRHFICVQTNMRICTACTAPTRRRGQHGSTGHESNTCSKHTRIHAGTQTGTYTCTHTSTHAQKRHKSHQSKQTIKTHRPLCAFTYMHVCRCTVDKQLRSIRSPKHILAPSHPFCSS